MSENTEPDTTVQIASYHTNRETYHSDDKCPNLPSDTRTVSVDMAERHGLSECKFCHGKNKSPKGKSQYVGLRAALSSDEYDVEYATDD